MRDHTKIAVILDRSGSMNSVREDTIGGFNRFLKDQQAASGSADISLYQFDHTYDVVYEGQDVKTAPELNAGTYVPRGSTALLDAIGRTINTLGATLSNLPEQDRPNKVIVVILTDGYENASHKFSREQVKTLIQQQENVYNWEFIFLGATFDAVDVAQSYGVKAGSAMSYNASKTGETFDKFSAAVTSYRGMNMVDVAALKGGSVELFSQKDREDVQ